MVMALESMVFNSKQQVTCLDCWGQVIMMTNTMISHTIVGSVIDRPVASLQSMVDYNIVFLDSFIRTNMLAKELETGCI